VLRTGGISRDERQRDVGFGHRGKFDLCFLGSFSKSLESLSIFSEVDAFEVHELVCNPRNHASIEVVSAQVRVSGCRLDLENAITHFENRDVECTAAKVEYENDFVFFL